MFCTFGYSTHFRCQQIYQHYKKYQIEHEKKFPPKGEALAKKWDEFKKKQEELHKMKAEKEAEAKANPMQKKEPEQTKGAPEKDAPKEKTAAASSSSEEKKEAPVKQEQKEEPMRTVNDVRTDVQTSEISTYNGAKTSKYNWS